MTDDIVLSAPILVADKPNSNGRIYPRAALESYIAKAKANGGSLPGVIGMDQDPLVSLGNVSHMCENLRIQGDTLVADIRVLKTPMGEELKKLLTSPGISFRTAGFGTLSADGKTITDFEPISINAVYDGAEL
jgi:hypothetical protein